RLCSTVISSFISIPQLGLKVLCGWIMVLLWSMINTFEKLIVWEIKLINYRTIERLKTSKINEPPFDPKEMGHWLVKHLDTQRSVSFKQKVSCLFLKCSSFLN